MRGRIHPQMRIALCHTETFAKHNDTSRALRPENHVDKGVCRPRHVPRSPDLQTSTQGAPLLQANLSTSRGRGQDRPPHVRNLSYASTYTSQVGESMSFPYKPPSVFLIAQNNT